MRTDLWHQVWLSGSLVALARTASVEAEARWHRWGERGGEKAGSASKPSPSVAGQGRCEMGQWLRKRWEKLSPCASGGLHPEPEKDRELLNECECKKE